MGKESKDYWAVKLAKDGRCTKITIERQTIFAPFSLFFHRIC